MIKKPIYKNTKKVGRPTESIKNKSLKLRVDEETLKNITDFSNDINKSKSEIIRNVIKSISSKDFEEMLSLQSLERLEKYSVECYEIFSKSNPNIKVSEVSKKFPAFVSPEESKIFIKYPTYKIRILSGNSSDKIISKVTNILVDIEGLSQIYKTHCALYNAETNNFEMTFLPEVMCLKSDLLDNENLKDEVISKLDKNNILYEVWPAYCIKAKDINIKNINGEDYIV